jgi:tetratricopeptide (TPR) repeat protein
MIRLAWLFVLFPVAAVAANPPVDLEGLYARLKAAPDPATALRLETELQEAWMAPASAAVQVLVEQMITLIHTDKAADALADADAAIVLQPELADLWRRRAEVRLVQGDDRGALADLAQALSRNPRLLPALADLSRLAEQRHEYHRALEAWEKFLALDPRTDGGVKREERLKHLAEGEPI